MKEKIILMRNNPNYRTVVFGDEEYVKGFKVQVKKLFWWVTIKTFQDENVRFAFNEAEELLETLDGGKDVKVRLL